MPNTSLVFFPRSRPLDIQNREIHLTVGRAGGGILTIEADLPNIIKKSVTIKQ